MRKREYKGGDTSPSTDEDEGIGNRCDEQYDATRSLIESIGDGQLSLSSTVPLAQMILESSPIPVGSVSSSNTPSMSGLIVSASRSQESMDSSGSDAFVGATNIRNKRTSIKSSSKIFQRLERNYRKRATVSSSLHSSKGSSNIDKSDTVIEHTMKEVEGLFKKLARREGDEYANNILNLMSRLAGSRIYTTRTNNSTTDNRVDNINDGDIFLGDKKSRNKRRSNTVNDTAMDVTKKVTSVTESNDRKQHQKESPPLAPSSSLADVKKVTFRNSEEGIGMNKQDPYLQRQSSNSSSHDIRRFKYVGISTEKDEDDDINNFGVGRVEDKPSSFNFAEASPSLIDLKNRTYMHEKNAICDEEMKILTECIYALQHMDGDHLRFRRSFAGMEMTPNRKARINLMDQHEGLQVRPGLLPFHLDNEMCVKHKSTRYLTSGAVDALKICGEAGWLFSRISNYIHEVVESRYCSRNAVNNETVGGVVPRALASSLGMEMQSYQRLLSSFEHQLQSSNPVGLTIRRLVTQLRGPINQLRTLALLVDGIDSSLNGGKLLLALYLHSTHGDVRHTDLVNRILYTTSIPWFDLLFDWTLKGLLPKGLAKKPTADCEENVTNSNWEFFVHEDNSVSYAHMWHGRYVLIEHQIPQLSGIAGGGILSVTLAKKILVLGKGINFIRKCLHDTEWNLDLRDLSTSTKLQNIASGMTLEYHDASTMKKLKAVLGFHYDYQNYSTFNPGGHTRSVLDSTVDAAAAQVHKHILESLFHQHHLIEHLYGMKNILFLGQGDFISALMDSLHSEFSSKDGIFMHSIMGVLHDALRSTNARCLPQYVIERIHVKLASKNNTTNQFWIEESFNDKKEEIWDIFSLCYEMDTPLTAVVHREAMEQYELVFSLLFRLKRIEWYNFSLLLLIISPSQDSLTSSSRYFLSLKKKSYRLLNSTWRQSIILNHSIQIMLSRYGDFATHESSVVRIKWLLRRYSMTGQAMIHFVSNFQSYMMFEVLESGWTELVYELGNSRTLDEVIQSHNKYLDTIAMKSLLGDMHLPQLGKQLRLVLTLVYRFCSMHESIFSKALASIQASNFKRQRAEHRSKDGNWGFEKMDPDVEGYNISELSNEERLQEIVEIDEEFDRALRLLLSMLNDKVNEVVDSDRDSMSSNYQSQDRDISNSNDTLRFLTFRLDFSDFYRNKQ